MIGPPRPLALRWALLGALAFAILGMHHLVLGGADHERMAGMAEGMAGSSITVSAPQAAAGSGAVCCGSAEHAALAHQGGEHSMLHLCLAILLASAAVLFASLLRSTAASVQRRSAEIAGRIPLGRGPPGRRASLPLRTALCVLRL